MRGRGTGDVIELFASRKFSATERRAGGGLEPIPPDTSPLIYYIPSAHTRQGGRKKNIFYIDVRLALPFRYGV